MMQKWLKTQRFGRDLGRSPSAENCHYSGTVCVCVLCVSVHTLWSLLHDSVISDLSPSWCVAVVQTQMSCPSLVYVWLGQKASTSESFKPTHTHENYKCSILRAYWEHHGFAGCHLDCCQTACEMCRSFRSSMDSFGDTSLQEAAFASGSSTITAWQLLSQLNYRELQKGWNNRRKNMVLILSCVFFWLVYWFCSCTSVAWWSKMITHTEYTVAAVLILYIPFSLGQ